MIASLLFPLAVGAQTRGGALATDPDGGTVWAALTDEGQVVRFDVRTGAIARARHVGRGPEQVLLDPRGRLLVTLRGEGAVVALDPVSLEEVGRVGIDAEPWGLACTADGATVLVTSAQGRALALVDGPSLVRRRVVVLPDPDARAVTVSADGRRAYVSHLVAPRVTVVDVPAGRVVRSIGLTGLRAFAAPFTDAANQDFGGALNAAGAFASLDQPFVPNRALSLELSRDERFLFVGLDLKRTGESTPPEQRPSGYGGRGGRGAPPVARGAIASVPLDGRGRPVLTVLAMVDPADLRLTRDGRRLWVVGAGLAHELDVGAPGEPRTLRLGLVEYGEGIALGPAPFVLDTPGARLQRLADQGALGALSATSFPMPDDTPEALRAGRTLFAIPSAAVSGGTVACQTCHPDGRHDGMVWTKGRDRFQTPVLTGRLGGTAPFHWLGTARTVQASIEETVVRLGGEGLPRAALVSLERFVKERLPRVPPGPVRPAPLVDRGRALFESDELACTRCHDPAEAYQDGWRHRLGDAEEIDVPSLRSVRLGAPFLHDGSVRDLDTLLGAWNRDDRMGHTSQLSTEDRRALIAFLETL